MFWSRKESIPYIALGQRDAQAAEELVGNEHASDLNKSKFTMLLIGITIVLSAANLTFYTHRYVNSASSKPPHFRDSQLELASAYIGLDKFQAVELENTTVNRTFENMPLVIASVDRVHPNDVRPDETPHWWTFQGLVVPDRRHIFVNETISTIVQFRALDFGLETCQPTIALPTYSSLVNSTVESDNNKLRTFTFSAPSVDIHVWLLESMAPDGGELELNYPRLTYENRPPRKEYLGIIGAREGRREVSEAFHCVTGALQTLELSCETPGCILDFWTDVDLPKMAFFIQQSPSRV